MSSGIAWVSCPDASTSTWPHDWRVGRSAEPRPVERARPDERASHEDGREMADVKLTIRNVVATLFVAAILVPYIGYLARGEMPFIEDPRGMSGTALVL